MSATYSVPLKTVVEEQGLEYGDPLRVRKQGDFDAFGHTLDIGMVPEVTPELLAQCASFPQYEVAESDVRAAVLIFKSQHVDEKASDHAGGAGDHDRLPGQLLPGQGKFRAPFQILPVKGMFRKFHGYYAPSRAHRCQRSRSFAR